jgi:endonuclease/exonuclease/phosphatase family metal-dependent hydrolase
VSDFNEKMKLLKIVAVSYNVHSCVGMDKKYDPERIARILRELNADIAGLQEVDSRYHPGTGSDRQLRMLAEMTGLEAVAGPSGWGEGRDFGNALLTRYPIRKVQHHSLSVAGLEPRGALDVYLDIHGAPLRLIVTHLGLRGSERRKQVKKMISLMHPPITGVILMGDFNEWGSLHRSLGRSINKVLGHSVRIRTFPSRYPVFALDRIWVYPPNLLSEIQPYNTPQTRIASDHLPLKAVIRAQVKDGQLQTVHPVAAHALS